MRFVTLAAVLLLAGCGGGPTDERGAGKPGGKSKSDLGLIGGLQLIRLGAPQSAVTEAYPIPADAEQLDDLPVLPNMPWIAWQVGNEENFAAVFDRNTGAVAVMHQTKLDNPEAGEEALDNYADYFGEGDRREGEDWVEVKYKRGNALLTLRVERDGDFVTFKESLEDLRVLDKLDLSNGGEDTK